MFEHKSNSKGAANVKFSTLLSNLQPGCDQWLRGRVFIPPCLLATHTLGLINWLMKIFSELLFASLVIGEVGRWQIQKILLVFLAAAPGMEHVQSQIDHFHSGEEGLEFFGILFCTLILLSFSSAEQFLLHIFLFRRNLNAPFKLGRVGFKSQRDFISCKRSIDVKLFLITYDKNFL